MGCSVSRVFALVSAGGGVSVQGTPLLNLKRRSPLLGPGDSVDWGNGYKFVI